MNSLFTVVILLSTLMLVSCNSGGGSSSGDGGSGSVSGSAVLPTSAGFRVDKMYLVYKPMY